MMERPANGRSRFLTTALLCFGMLISDAETARAQSNQVTAATSSGGTQQQQSPPAAESDFVTGMCAGGVPAGIECRCLDLVFLVDITSSIPLTQDLENQLCSTIDCAVASAGSGLRVGLITFDDTVTVHHWNEGGIEESLTSDIAAVKATIDDLVSMGTPGGQFPEASDEALREMLRVTVSPPAGSACLAYGTDPFNTPFRAACVKMAVLITDDLPGGCDSGFTPGVDDVNAHERALEALAAGINIHAVYLPTNQGSEQELIRPIMRDYAETTDGFYTEVYPYDTPINVALADLFCSDCNMNGIPDVCEEPFDTVRVYVDKDATGTPIDGKSWDTAFRDLQGALDLPVPCRGITFEIWVAEGTYKPTDQTSRYATFALRNNVEIYGGFMGDETSREQRDPFTYVTVLSGDIGTAGEHSDNSYHVVSAIDTDATPVLDGFTITGGYAYEQYNYRGAGIFCDKASPTIRSCRIENNQTPDGIIGSGGGVFCHNDSAPTIVNCLIAHNRAYYGGGIEVGGCYSAAPTIANCTIVGNTAFWAGGIDCYLSTDLVVANCIIWGNAAAIGAQISVSEYSSATVSHSDVQDRLGTGAYFDGTSMLTWDSGDIHSPPSFVNAPTDYRLAAGSPCIDAGDSAVVPAGTTLDLDGYLRFADDPATTDCQWETGTCGTAPIVDMGAYEYGSAPPDTDGDGVPDPWDLCPDTPACAAHLVDGNGCVEGAYTDEDNDGVVDACDNCTGTPTCARPVDEDGCPSDGDGDGVFNGCDDCPDTQAIWLTYGTVDVHGCLCGNPNQDRELDGDVDLTDFGLFSICFNGPNRPAVLPDQCYCQDDDGDGDVDLADFAVFAACFNGPNRPHRCPSGASAPEGGGFAMSSLFGGERLLETVDVTFALNSNQDQQTISAGTPVDWAAIVEVTGSNQGLASFVFDLELREGSATGPLAGVTLGTGVWDDAFAVAGPDGQPETGAGLTATGSVGGPGMNALSSTGYNATPGLLEQVGSGYLSWDPWRESGKSWTGNSTWGVGLDAHREALLLDALGSYSLATGTIDTTNLDPGDYVLRLVPAANIGVLSSGIDLNSPAAGVTELTGSVSEPVTIEFTIGEE